jgi:adenylate kinase family enzyme
MQRVLVIGPGGAGKSTLARRLSERTGLPLVHLDALHWRPGWVAVPREEWSRTIDSLLARERWIMDGNYGGTLDRRLAACDTVIFLDASRIRCVQQVVKRRLRGRRGPDMAEGCPERLTWSFLWWIWTYPTRRRPGILQRLSALRADQHAVVLRSRADVERFLAAV